MSEIPVKAKAVPAQAFSNNVSGTNTSSPQKVRNCSGYSMESAASIHEITLIDNMTSFLKAHGGAKVDENNLREMAEALSHMNCTSPGTLQDVTMDNSYSVGYRSPCVSLQQYQGTTSPPVQGRSVREFEEQMASLRKENFNLKLRLYFIEESIPGYQQCSSSEGHETIMKQLIDTKVEMEILRKEIQEKQEILKEAALAMNQMEKIQKETETKSQEVIDELKQKIQFLEMERDMDKSHQGDFMNELLGRSDLSENLNALQKIRELEGIVKQSDEKIADFQRQISKLENDMNKRDEAIKEYEEKVKELVFQNAELLEAIENKEKDITTAERLREEVQQKKSELADRICQLQEAEEKFEQSCRTIQKLFKTIKNQQDEINRLKHQTSAQGLPLANTNKENTSGNANLSDAESSGVRRSLSDTEAFNELSTTQKQKFESIIEQQETTIKYLQAEVKKKTANLQTLVNKELWEKNREIERLTKLVNHNKSQPSLNNTANTSSNSELQQSYTDAEYAEALERNKLLQRKVDVLIKRLGAERNNEEVITQLRSELQQAHLETESADKWRRECADVCSVLTHRLEELAGFLNTLLRHKDVLGFLAADRRRAMRNAVDRSLDLSKSLNMTLSVSGISLPEHSFAQLSNLSGILGDLEGGIEDSRCHALHEQTSVDTLRAENKALKRELDRRRSAEQKKDRRSLTLPAMENQSESEAWSEPDRKVSLARIGLEDHSAARDSQPSQRADSESDSDALNESRVFKARTQERLSHLEQMVAQRDDRVLQIQCELFDTENRLKKESALTAEAQQEIALLRKQNADLVADLAAIGNNGADETAHLQRQIEEQAQSLTIIQQERERIAVEARFAEMQISSLKEEHDRLKINHELELTLAAEEQQRKMDELQRSMEALMLHRLAKQQQQHNEALVRDWVARGSYEESEKQLADLRRQLGEAQNSIEYLQENEEDLKQTQLESEQKLRALKKQLDESTLQASKAVTERTKANNEKLQLEKRVQELDNQQRALAEECERLQCELTKLEQTHKELCEQIAIETTARLNGSDVSQSGYTSEEVGVAQLQGKAVAMVASATEHVGVVGAQRHNNSSPDLGIESDAGRVSSVELSNAQRSLLKTVELSVANKNVKRDFSESQEERDSPQTQLKTSQTVCAAGAEDKRLSDAVSHDCAKVEQENIDLRRKLTRTKRAFEDACLKLRVSNQRKEQVEKDIKNQILKTHNVLKNVRSNMEK